MLLVPIILLLLQEGRSNIPARLQPRNGSKLMEEIIKGLEPKDCATDTVQDRRICENIYHYESPERYCYAKGCCYDGNAKQYKKCFVNPSQGQLYQRIRTDDAIGDLTQVIGGNGDVMSVLYGHNFWKKGFSWCQDTDYAYMEIDFLFEYEIQKVEVFVSSGVKLPESITFQVSDTTEDYREIGLYRNLHLGWNTFGINESVKERFWHISIFSGEGFDACIDDLQFYIPYEENLDITGRSFYHTFPMGGPDQRYMISVKGEEDRTILPPTEVTGLGITSLLVSGYNLLQGATRYTYKFYKIEDPVPDDEHATFVLTDCSCNPPRTGGGPRGTFWRMGCFELDPKIPVSLTIEGNSNARCAGHCATVYTTGLALFSMTLGDLCYCSREVPSTRERTSGQCNQPCRGNSDDDCGAPNVDPKLVTVFRSNVNENQNFFQGDADHVESQVIAGAPSFPAATQKRGGEIYLQWSDSSTCEDRFEYFMCEDDPCPPLNPSIVSKTWKNVFKYSKELTTTEQCGFRYRDVLLEEKVGSTSTIDEMVWQFGKTYRFALRTNVAREQARQYVDYSIVLFSFNSLWEAVLTGRVTSTGGSGVRLVSITASFEGSGIDITTLTDASGTYEIWLSGFFPEFEQVVRVTPYMESDGLVHEFKCGQSEKQCEFIDHPIRHDTELNSMQLASQELGFIDLTVVDFRGMVRIEEPSDFDIICGKEYVEVCIYSIRPPRVLDPEFDCITTESDGHYILQAPMGLDVEYHVNATYDGHEIVTEDDPTTGTFVYGPDVIHDKVDEDFIDKSRRDVEVTVVGGTNICDTQILDWMVAVSPVNCPEVVFYIDGSEAKKALNFTVAGQAYTFRLVGDDDFDHRSTQPTDLDGNQMETEYEVAEVENYFQFYRPLVDLTSYDPTVLERVRFEYHLPATLELSVDYTLPNDCELEDFIALENLETYRFSVRLFERFGPTRDQECHHVVGNLTMYGLAQVGDAPPPGCADPATGYSCEVPVEYDETSHAAVANFLVTPVLPALPLHQMAFEFLGEIDDFPNLLGLRIVQPIFVYGINQISEALQVPVPEHTPLFVLREPPGDRSFSSLEKGSTISLDISMASEEEFAGRSKTNIGLGPAAESDAGFILSFKVAKAVVYFKGGTTGGYGTSKSFSDSMRMNVELEETFSSPGAGDRIDMPGYGTKKGKSDMFLCPAFNVEFSFAQEFFLNDTSCDPDMRNTFTWELPDELQGFDPNPPGNVHHPSANIFAWYSQEHIEEYKIPELEDILENHDCKEECKDAEIPEQCELLCPTKILIVEDSLVGWRDLIAWNERLKAGATELVTKEKLIGEKSDIQQFKNRNVGSNIGAASNTLWDYGSGFVGDIGKYQTQTQVQSGTTGILALTHLMNYLRYPADNKMPSGYENRVQKQLDDFAVSYPMNFGNTQRDNYPQNVHQLTFSGGGSEYSYSYTTTQTTQAKFAAMNSGTQEITTEIDSEIIIVAIGNTIENEAETGRTLTTEKEVDIETESTVTTSFTLMDDDVGDDFTFEVLEDSNGWLYFRTLGGKSSCPHEIDTIPREKIRSDLNLTYGPPDIEGLQQDDFARWELRVMNESPTGDAFPIVVEVAENPNNLITFVNGLEFETHSRHMEVPPNGELQLLISALRPEGTVFFFPLAISLTSECDEEISYLENLSVEFAEDCPTAEFITLARWLPREEGTVLVTAYNGKWRTNPWRPLPDPDQTLNIYLFYRMITPYGTDPPKDVFLEEPFDLNFAEDNINGRTDFDWDVTNIVEGDYELWFDSECISFAQTTTRSEFWQGAIDHTAPVLVYYPEPQDAVWTVGDEVSFQFNEAIVCDYQVEMHWKAAENDPYIDQNQVDLRDQYRPVCVADGADGKILFNVNRYLRDVNPGRYYRIRAFDVTNTHARRNPDLFQYEFRGEDPTVHFHLSTYVPDREYFDEESSLGFELCGDELQIIESESVNNNGNMFCLGSGAEFGKVDIDFSNYVSKGPEGYYYELFYDILADSDGKAEVNAQGWTVSLWSSSIGKQMIAAHETPVDNPPAASISGCSNRQCKMSFEFTNPGASVSPCIDLKTISWQAFSVPVWLDELSRLSGVSPERIDLTNVDSSPTHTQFSFSVSEHAVEDESPEIRPHEVAKALQNVVDNKDMHHDFHLLGLDEHSTIDFQKDIVTPVCKSELREYMQPHILGSKSGFELIDNGMEHCSLESSVTIIVRTSVLLPEVDFRFVGAENEAARYAFTSKGISHATPFWTHEITDQCWRDFSLTIDWLHFTDHGIGGLVETLDESIFETTLRVTTHVFDDEQFFDLKIFVQLPSHLDLGNYHRLCEGCKILTSCSEAPNIEHGSDLASCAGTLSGQKCGVECTTGYLPSNPYTLCQDGYWSNVHCKDHYFASTRGTFEEVRRFCSSRDGQLAIIHSPTENTAVKKLCEATAGLSDELCYIGLVRSDRFNFEWMDKSSVDYNNWDDLQPSNGRVHSQDTVVGIQKSTGKWDDYGAGYHKLVGICSYGECIPDDMYLMDLPAEQVTYGSCGPIRDPQTVYITDGCQSFPVEFTQTDRVQGNSANEYTFSRTWNVVTVSRFETRVTQCVSVVDRAPTFGVELAPDISVSCGEDIPEPWLGTAVDQCDGDVSVQYQETRFPDVDADCGYTIARTWNAIDSVGNNVSMTQNVRVGAPEKLGHDRGNKEFNVKEVKRALALLEELLDGK